MFAAPIVNVWFDIIVISLIFAGINKLVQHLTIDPHKYFEMKKKTKDLQKEMKQLAKEQKMEEMKKKQSESFAMIGDQFRIQMKAMFIMFAIALPILWFVNKYYVATKYNFLLFTANGFWAYVIFGVIFSLIISSLYDKLLMKKYITDNVVDKISK